MVLIEEITSPFMRLGYGVIDAIPGVIAAVLILLVGYFVAWLVGRLVGGVLQRLRFDQWALHKTNLKHIVGEFRLSHFLELISKWYVFILFVPAAANVINLGAVQNFLLDVALWIPQVIVAVVLGLIGLMAADYVSATIKDVKGKASRVLASAAKVVILVFTALIVLEQIGVRVDVARNSVLIILGGIMLALALIFGIGFGLGLQDEAKKIVADLRRKL